MRRSSDPLYHKVVSEAGVVAGDCGVEVGDIAGAGFLDAATWRQVISDGNVDPVADLLTPIAIVLEFGGGICDPPTSVLRIGVVAGAVE